MKHALRNTALDLLIRIEKDSFSHLLISNTIKAKTIPQKDEGLLTEIVYGTLQYKLTLDYYLLPFLKSKKKLDTWVQLLLQMSVYQMVYLDKVPDHAIIHEAVEIAKQRGHKGIASFVNGVLRSVQRKGVADTSEIEDDAKRLSIATSHPEWLTKRWIDQYGFERAKGMCEANLKRKPTAVRVQPLRITREEVIDQLEAIGFDVEASRLSGQGIVIHKGNILHTDLFKDGFVTIQDQSSMLVGEMIDVQPGMTVLDSCSAPGGKTTHIAEKLENTGQIHAYDLHEKKAASTSEKALELKLTNVKAAQADARHLREMHADETFDRILVDAPCSGLGVIRGKPEVKYHKQEADIERLAEIQFDILKEVAALLKQEGRLVYSTCTVDRHENEQVVKRFLIEHPEFEVDKDFFATLPEHVQESNGITAYGFQLFPQDFDTDGFFLTRLKRK